MHETEIKKYLRVLRNHRLLIGGIALVCAVLAGIYAWTREPVYEAETQLFVSTSSAEGASASQIYEGGLASQSRAESYATLLTSATVIEAVIARLGLSESVKDVQAKITATAPPETALIDITVSDDSADEATEIATALTEEFPAFVADLEATADGANGAASPVEVSVTSPPERPTSPASPGELLFVIGGLMLGLLLGVGAAIGREVLDRRVRDDEDAAEAVSGAPVLGRIPRDPRAAKRPLVVISEPDSPQAEAYRRLRTNLRPTLLENGRRSLLIASAVPGEGKTLIAANLAVAFAQSGHAVALVDADLRRPGIHRLFDLSQEPGLAEVLAEGSGRSESVGRAFDHILHREQRFPLEVLAAGTPDRQPSDLLDSDEFPAVIRALESRAEIVIIDSPALLPVGDAAVIARAAGAALMVARVTTRVEDLDLASESLRTVGAAPVGAVLNAVPDAGSAYIYGPKQIRTAREPAWQTRTG